MAVMGGGHPQAPQTGREARHLRVLDVHGHARGQRAARARDQRRRQLGVVAIIDWTASRHWNCGAFDKHAAALIGLKLSS